MEAEPNFEVGDYVFVPGIRAALDGDLKNIAEDILKFAKKRGASACEVDVSEGFGQSVSVRRDEVDTIEYNRDKGVGVTIYDGQKRGYASTSDFSKDALKATVDAAVSIARFTAPDPAAGLPDAALLASRALSLSAASGSVPPVRLVCSSRMMRM